MGLRLLISFLATSVFCQSALADTDGMKPEVVRFQNGDKELGGELFKPEGPGPFPAVLYNHGSAPGMSNSEASKLIAPLFVARGWVFFMPYRRGQGLSKDAGPYIIDQIRNVRRSSWPRAAHARMTELLQNEHLSDQLAGLTWLKAQSFVDRSRIATAGNSYGGIEVMFGVAKEDYCAGVNASGAAQTWASSPELQAALKDSARNARAPVFFFQAANDYNVAPSYMLAAEMAAAGKTSVVKLYPKFHGTPQQGHSFPYRSTLWFDDAFAFIERHCG